jgi:hypothetical protein
VNRQFHEGGELVAEFTDSHYIVRKRGDMYEYRLNSLTHHWIASHVSGSDHNVFFAQDGDRHKTTVAVTFADRQNAEELKTLSWPRCLRGEGGGSTGATGRRRRGPGPSAPAGRRVLGLASSPAPPYRRSPRRP